jgi:hypothetical protein
MKIIYIGGGLGLHPEQYENVTIFSFNFKQASLLAKTVSENIGILLLTHVCIK